ncbi:transcription factor MYB97-like [Gastrolobium bilobum]|uniref:transcription factor MYB97-like n=1 Tax=Gastrolobium bilobum TaxID=150636 RepID=UPI002AAF5EE4|nr:transcription factor MYB97-like [Gastrolobium bilobum]
MPRMIHFNKSYENEAISKEGGDDDKETMNKGPWTPQEDTTLRDYVSTYGEGMWNSVYKRSGLARCGKSCRLRWANHLRPYLKKGAFSKEEEQLVIQLHAQLGNKWARMAVQCFAANESYDYQSGSYNHGLDSNADLGGSPYESLALVQGLNTKFSSSLSPPGSTHPNFIIF